MTIVLYTVIHANSTDRSRKERIRFSHPLSSSLVNSWEGSGDHEIDNACFLQKVSVPLSLINLSNLIGIK